MRMNLKYAREKEGLSKQDIADYLGVSLRYYQMIEAGTRTGKYKIWDALEQLLQTPQIKLRCQSNLEANQG